MTTPDRKRLESLVQAWSVAEDPVESVRQALERTDDHPALALWAYQDERVWSQVSSHRKIAGWVDILRRVVPAETWDAGWGRLLDRLPVPLRMWVLHAWSRRWPPESDFWAGCLNDPTVLQWLLQWSRQDPTWQTWVAERARHIRSERMRRKLLPEVPEALPPETETPTWHIAPTAYYVTPMNGRYYWILRYTTTPTDVWVVLGLRTQADRTVQDALFARVGPEDLTRAFGRSHRGYPALLGYLLLHHTTFFRLDLDRFVKGQFRNRTVRWERIAPFIVQALERTPRDAWPLYLRTYAPTFIDPWLRWDAMPELRQVQSVLTASVFSATGSEILPFSHPKEAFAFLAHLFNVLWSYHAPEEATRLVDWLDEITRDLQRSPFLDRFIDRYRGTVFAPAPPRLTPEIRQALAKAYFLVRNRPWDETLATGMKTLLAWTLQDLIHWLRHMARTTSDLEDMDMLG